MLPIRPRVQPSPLPSTENRVVIKPDVTSRFGCDDLCGVPQRIFYGCYNVWRLGNPRRNFVPFTAEVVRDPNDPDKYIGIQQVQIAWKNSFFITDPWIIAEIYKSNRLESDLFSSSDALEYIGDIFHPIVMTPPVDLHKMRYKVYLSHLMHIKSLQNFVPMIREQMHKVLDDFENGQKNNISRSAAKFAILFAAKGLFDIEVNVDEIISLAEKANELLDSKLANPTFYLKAEGAAFKKEALRVLGLEDSWSNSTAPILQNLKSVLEKYVPEEERVQAYEGLLCSLLFSAVDTTMIALPNIINVLGHNPLWQKKLIEERGQREEASASDSEWLWQYLKDKNTNLHRVFLEAIRLYPPTLTNERQVSQDIVLQERNGEFHRIPKGASMMLMHYYAGRNSQLWGENSNVFNPNRFLDENVRQIPFPLIFAQGPTACPGSRMLELEAKIFVLELLQKYNWTSCEHLEDVTYRSLFLLKPDHDLHIELSQKEKKE